FYYFYDAKRHPTLIRQFLDVLWLLIIFKVLFSVIFNSMLTIGKFSFPRESIQYISRFLFFIIIKYIKNYVYFCWDIIFRNDGRSYTVFNVILLEFCNFYRIHILIIL